VGKEPVEKHIHQTVSGYFTIGAINAYFIIVEIELIPHLFDLLWGHGVKS
jgi:hypothetical protein